MKSNAVWEDADENDELAAKWNKMDREEAEEAENARFFVLEHTYREMA